MFHGSINILKSVLKKEKWKKAVFNLECTSFCLRAHCQTSTKGNNLKLNLVNSPLKSLGPANLTKKLNKIEKLWFVLFSFYACWNRHFLASFYLPNDNYLIISAIWWSGISKYYTITWLRVNKEAAFFLISHTQKKTGSASEMSHTPPPRLSGQSCYNQTGLALRNKQTEAT